ncbi:MAG: HAMP domain-containing sensor histidine kinase [Mucilaginibacter sp.]
MKKRSISIIIGLMTFALLGVVAMQLYFLTQSYDLQSKLFDRSVNEALNTVVTKLAKQDHINFLNRKAEHVLKQQGNSNDSVQVKVEPTLREHHLAALRDSLKSLHNELSDFDQSGSLNLQVQIVQYTNAFGQIETKYIPELVDNPKRALLNKQGKINKYDTISKVPYYDPLYGKQVYVQKQINPLWLQEQMRKKKERQLAQVKKMLAADSLQNLASSGQAEQENLYEEYQKSGEPLKNRISPFWIDSLLTYELHNRGIDLRFSYVVTTSGDSLIYAKSDNPYNKKPIYVDVNNYQTPIFNKEVINDPGLLKLSFPEKSSWILGSMRATMATTAGLLFVLVFCFGYTIFSIIRQKKIAEMKTDFINNMTHEFKTPVSTIMIASEALKDDEIVNDKARISRLANIIYEENERLGSHIERVLNVARIDKNDFKLDNKPVDINEMVSVVLDSMALKLQKSNTEVVLNLDAENAVINADELHFSNVLYNLIDNAIKYSQSTPHITISTFNKSGHIVIKVADKGIGMGRDQQAKIFEQFYRIPTGNLHDVKGFGLGLSYVNTIVKRLNGTIAVRSEKDKGSEFEIKFSVA